MTENIRWFSLGKGIETAKEYLETLELLSDKFAENFRDNEDLAEKIGAAIYFAQIQSVRQFVIGSIDQMQEWLDDLPPQS